jgi:hypothetical protein
VYELLYGGEGSDGKPFALGLIDPESLTGLEGRAVDSGAVEQKDQEYDSNFEHEKGQFEVGSSLHSAPIEPGSRAGESEESPGPAGSNRADSANGVKIAPREMPSDGAQRTDTLSYPPSSLAASTSSGQAADSNGQEVDHAA